MSLQFTSSIVSEITISDAVPFFEVFAPTAVDRTITMHVDLNHAFRGLPLPYNHTDTNPDIGQTKYPWEARMKEIAHFQFIDQVKRSWASLRDVAVNATDNDQHGEQARQGLEYLFDAGDANQLVSGEPNTGKVIRIKQSRVDQWINARKYLENGVEAATTATGAPFYRIVDPSSQTAVYDTARAASFTVDTSFLQAGAYGDNVFDESQIVELLDAANDAGKCYSALFQQPLAGESELVAHTGRFLNLEENDAFAVRVVVTQHVLSGPGTSDDMTNSASWLVKLVHKSGETISTPPDHTMDPRALHLMDQADQPETGGGDVFPVTAPGGTTWWYNQSSSYLGSLAGEDTNTTVTDDSNVPYPDDTNPDGQ